jgi:hypothetical protein
MASKFGCIEKEGRMNIPGFTAEASLRTANWPYRNARIALTPTASPTVTPALAGHRGDCVSFCDVFGYIWCCGGICDPEYH